MNFEDGVHSVNFTPQNNTTSFTVSLLTLISITITNMIHAPRKGVCPKRKDETPWEGVILAHLIDRRNLKGQGPNIFLGSIYMYKEYKDPQKISLQKLMFRGCSLNFKNLIFGPIFTM